MHIVRALGGQGAGSGWAPGVHWRWWTRLAGPDDKTFQIIYIMSIIITLKDILVSLTHAAFEAMLEVRHQSRYWGGWLRPSRSSAPMRPSRASRSGSASIMHRVDYDNFIVPRPLRLLHAHVDSVMTLWRRVVARVSAEFSFPVGARSWLLVGWKMCAISFFLLDEKSLSRTKTGCDPRKVVVPRQASRPARTI